MPIWKKNESCGIGHLGQREEKSSNGLFSMRFNKFCYYEKNCETAIGTAGLLN